MSEYNEYILRHFPAADSAMSWSVGKMESKKQSFPIYENGGEKITRMVGAKEYKDTSNNFKGGDACESVDETAPIFVLLGTGATKEEALRNAGVK